MNYQEGSPPIRVDTTENSTPSSSGPPFSAPSSSKSSSSLPNAASCRFGGKSGGSAIKTELQGNFQRQESETPRVKNNFYDNLKTKNKPTKQSAYFRSSVASQKVKDSG
jgi:hypothetical protein